MSNEEEIVPPNSLADAERGERIRQRAYQLWEEDGSQEGRADVYWHGARELLDQRPKGEEQPHDDFLIQRAAGGSFSSVRMLISRQIEAFHYQP